METLIETLDKGTSHVLGGMVWDSQDFIKLLRMEHVFKTNKLFVFRICI